jgi:hypothetical protein
VGAMNISYRHRSAKVKRTLRDTDGPQSYRADSGNV